MIANNASRAGTSITAITSRNGDNRTNMSLAPYELCEIGPAAVVDAAASMRPISIEPESPMKMRAGWKLWGRKPAHAPARTAAISALIRRRVLRSCVCQDT